MARRNVRLFASRVSALSVVVTNAFLITSSLKGRRGDSFGLSGNQAAVGDDCLASDEAARVRKEQERWTHHLAWVADSTHERRGPHGGDELRRIATHHVGIDRS